MNEQEGLDRPKLWRRRALAGGFLALILPLSSCTDAGHASGDGVMPVYGPAAFVGEYPSADGRLWGVACIRQAKYVLVEQQTAEAAAYANLPPVRLSSELYESNAEPVPEDVVVKAMLQMRDEAGLTATIEVPLLCTGQPQG